MTITITQGGKVRLGENDVRTFEPGEVHDLLPAHEAKLIGLGVAREGGPEQDEPKAADPVPVNKAIQPVEANKALNPVTENKAALKRPRSKKAE